MYLMTQTKNGISALGCHGLAVSYNTAWKVKVDAGVVDDVLDRGRRSSLPWSSIVRAGR